MSPGTRRHAIWRRALAVGLIAAAAAWPIGAETLYVIDRLEIGVHESRNIDSIVVEVVPTGTPLEVLERRGEFVKVRTPTGITGWVDGAYVTEEQPASVATDALEAQLAETRRELGAARAEVEVLRQQLAESTAGAAAGDEMQGSSSAAAAAQEEVRDQAAELGATLEELQALAEENQRLKRRLSELRAEQAASIEAMREANAEPTQVNPQPERRATAGAQSASSWLGLGPWQWALAGFVLLLAFALGGYVVDWQTRRRHGGFRV